MRETLICLPGTLCPPAIFDRLAQRLEAHYDLDAVSWLTEPGPWDVPSIAGRIAGRIEAGGSGPAVVCGHSTGGAIALQLASSRPELVKALILVDTGAHMQGHGDVGAIVAKIRDEWGEPLRAGVLDRSFAEPLSAELRHEWLAWSAQVQQQAAYDVLVSQAALDLRPALADISAPTVVIHGVHDRSRSVADAEELASSIPGATLHVLDVGHTPVHEAPDAVAELVEGLHYR